MALHGPHHGAQKSTSRGVDDAATAALNVSAVRWLIFSDMIIIFKLNYIKVQLWLAQRGEDLWIISASSCGSTASRCFPRDFNSSKVLSTVSVIFS